MVINPFHLNLPHIRDDHNLYPPRITYFISPRIIYYIHPESSKSLQANLFRSDVQQVIGASVTVQDGAFFRTTSNSGILAYMMPG